jgi:protease I
MADELKGMKIAFLATDMVEESELTGPWQALKDAGADPELVSVNPNAIQMARHHDKSGTFRVDRLVSGVAADDYEALVLPGGVANPDTLRMNPDAVRFVRAFFDQGKPVGAICHGPWLLVEADVVKGRTVTSWPSLQTDLRNAGAEWVDEQVVVDEGLVTRPLSTTTSSSTHSAPAFLRSVCRLGHEVTLRPLAMPDSTSIHGPWQIAPTGLSCSTNARTNFTASGSARSMSGLATPPGSTSAS